MTKDVHAISWERESDGRWLAIAEDIPGVMAYGDTKELAIRNVLRLIEELSMDI